MQKWPEGYVQQEAQGRIFRAAHTVVEWEIAKAAVLAKRDEFRTIWNLTNINEFVEDIK